MATATTILLVIDDPPFRGNLMAALRHRGMRPVLMADPEQARGYLAMDPPDLVVVDPRIPGEGGVAWIRARRAEGHRVPIVLCAATRDEATSLFSIARDLAVSSIVPKNVPPDAIAAHVEDLLRAPATPADTGGTASRLAELLERLRVTVVELQKNPEARPRIQAAREAARVLGTAAKPVAGAEPVLAAAMRVDELMVEAQEGRSRLDGSTWSQIDRALVRAREALARSGASLAAASTPPAPDRRPAASAYAEAAAEPAAPSHRFGVDELTGLLLRETFLAAAEERVGGAMIDGRPLSLCVLGLDGAPALRTSRKLDATLQAVGAFLASRFRPEDLRARWASDGFALAFPGTPASMAVANMGRTLDALKATGAIPLGMSVGVASYPKDGAGAAAVLAVAQRRMESARSSGGGTRGP